MSHPEFWECLMFLAKVKVFCTIDRINFIRYCDDFVVTAKSKEIRRQTADYYHRHVVSKEVFSYFQRMAIPCKRSRAENAVSFPYLIYRDSKTPESQKGKCEHCQTPIRLETGWHIHHIQPKHLGGTDRLDNLVLLHPNCHRQVHSKDP